MNLKLELCIAAFLACTLSFAQKVDIRTVYANGRTARKTVVLKEQIGYSELCIPKAKLRGIDTLEVIPSFARANAGEEGYFLSTDGYLTRFLENRPDTTRNLYKKHPLAMAGIKTPRGSWVELFETYRFEMSLVTSHSNGCYSTKLQYIFSGIEPYEDLVLRVYTLNPEDSDYSAMGRLYRKLKVEGTLKPLSERTAYNPLLKYAVDNPEIRIRQAWKPVPTPAPEQTRENEPSVRVKVTFDRCCEIVDALRAGGVDGAQLTLVGWNYKGHDGRFPTVFPPEITLGGEPALRRLICYAQSKGYQIVPHICTGDAYRVSEDFDERDLAVTKDGTLDSRFIYGSGKMYQLCPKVSYEKFVQKINDTLRDYGFRGVEYNDVYSIIPPVSCHNPAHPLNSKEAAEYDRKILLDGATKIGGIASEGGFDHVASVLDFALYVSMSGPESNFGRLKDEYVPLWHIIYNGYIYSCPFSQSVNYPIKPSEVAMKIMEYGCHPTFYYYSAHRDDSKNWIGTKDLDLKCETDEEMKKSVEIIREGYDYMKDYGYIQYLTMEDHTEISPKVYCTTFSDGTKTICNYSDKTFLYNGVQILSQHWHTFKKTN